ncbi:MAG: hypothetical protein HON94_06200 [Methylococcales bacterium]|jgi:hypothetical protein|nr:hypothetical protein [Methylococcales bacterium]MBT7410216.1 hypothetical protein [Methylococcales bacterium]
MEIFTNQDKTLVNNAIQSVIKSLAIVSDNIKTLNMEAVVNGNYQKIEQLVSSSKALGGCPRMQTFKN